jgi:ABC-type phosphate transport system substrate-binding protein
MKNLARTLGLTAALLLATAAGAADRPFVVVVHPDSPVASLTAAELSAAYLGKTAKWGDGSRVQPVDQPADGPLYKAMAESVHGKSPADLKGYWVKQVFAGKGVPPPTKGADGDVLAFVKNNPGAIGYVSPGADVKGVKVVAVKD